MEATVIAPGAQTTVVGGQMVNTQTGEVMSGGGLPSAFFAPKIEGLRLLNQPRDYRALVAKEKGTFECNGVEKGAKIKMRILNYRLEHGVRFGAAYPQPETVVQVVFADEQDLISTVVFRTSSMDNFLRMVDNTVADQIPLAGQIVTAEMEKTTTQKGYSFYIAKFKYEPNTEDNVRKIIAFVNAVPEALNCFRDLPREGAEAAHSA